jgi:hypothetical protein
VDGVIVVATVSVVAVAGRPGVWYAWLLLAAGAAVSVTANAIQAALAEDVAAPRPMAAAVASVPPVVLLAITHLTVVLTKTPPKPPAPASPGPSWEAPAADGTEPPVPAPPAWAGPPTAASTPPSRPPASPSAVRAGSQKPSVADPAPPGPAWEGARAVGRAGLGEGSRTWLVERARELRAEGLSYRAVGRRLGKDATTIARWLRDDHLEDRPSEGDGDGPTNGD